ncbi:hypothetical protein M0812_07625 [Anaeramoeba flamelloides]|uniref:HECT-type E3 ubiquitin transferase n=1 Tax=Anaeramoeba flamelloides TaxID=1746091 RepID=A0AAV8A1G6_9EUKA|nr:hypothetical protein M0812_07625 [Anaeramoeba flamelloides]
MNKKTVLSSKEEVQDLIIQYYIQFSNGCDNVECRNEFCRSCVQFQYRDLVDYNVLTAQALRVVIAHGSRLLCKIPAIKKSRLTFSNLQKLTKHESEKSKKYLKKLINRELSSSLLSDSFLQDLSLEEDVFIALDKQISQIEKVSKISHSYKLLRRIVILLCLDNFWEYKYVSYFERLLLCYSNLPTTSHLIVRHWWEKSYPIKILTQLIQKLNQFIHFKIYYNGDKSYPPSESILLSIRMMSDIYLANKLRKDQVKINEFYCAAINESFDHESNLRCFSEKNGFSYLNYPFIVSAETKSQLLSVESRAQMNKIFRDSLYDSIYESTPLQPYFILTVRRDHLVTDAVNAIVQADPIDLKKKLKVSFENEEGVDEGGVKKEFFQLIVQQLFDPKYGMFLLNSEANESHYWFNKSYIGEYEQYRLIGTLLGLAIYNSVILETRFPKLLYKKLLQRSLGIEDLAEINPKLARGLIQLLEFEGDVEQVFVRTFEISYFNDYDEEVFVDLKPNGSKIPLTNENREEYVKLRIEYELVTSIKEQFHGFREGFELLCQSQLFQFIHQDELELLICGDPHFKMSDLKLTSQYLDGYHNESQQISWLWEIILNWGKEKQKQFLLFTFGTDRVPIGGLSKLKFVVVKGGPDSESLPKSATCFGILILPGYSSKEKLKGKLELAIENCSGFGLY